MASDITPELIKDFVIASHFNLEKVKTLLKEHPALLTVKQPWGENDFEDGLAAASHVGNRAIAEFFLEQGVPLTICAAAMLGKVDEVEAFLQGDPGLANARGAHGITVLFHAAMSGNTELTQLLKSRGCTEGYSYALHGAINYGHKDMVDWLLNNGATRLDVLDYQGKTLLQRAAETNRADIADLLKQHGAVE
jgi:ankyrin repeat protein